MPGVPRELAEHKLNADPKVRPVKQSLRPFNEERRRAIAEEVQRLLAAGFIRPIKYSKWLANPVLVENKNGTWRMCIDYTNLNSACPKEQFVLPRIDQIIDSTAGSESLCFLDAYSGYNQIKMAVEDGVHHAIRSLLLHHHDLRPQERRGNLPAVHARMPREPNWPQHPRLHRRRGREVRSPRRPTRRPGGNFRQP